MFDANVIEPGGGDSPNGESDMHHLGSRRESIDLELPPGSRGAHPTGKRTTTHRVDDVEFTAGSCRLQTSPASDSNQVTRRDGYGRRRNPKRCCIDWCAARKSTAMRLDCQMEAPRTLLRCRACDFDGGREARGRRLNMPPSSPVRFGQVIEVTVCQCSGARRGANELVQHGVKL